MTTWQTLPPGIIGNKATLDVMRANVTEAVLDPFQLTRKCCVAILEQAHASGDKIESAHALFDWIVGNVIFRRDPFNVEQPIPPTVLLAQAEEFARSGGKASRPVADCKSQASLMAALGFSVGLPICWVVIGPSADEFSHVYACMDLVPGARDDASMLAIDTATTVPTFGVHSTLDARWVVDAINAY